MSSEEREAEPGNPGKIEISEESRQSVLYLLSVENEVTNMKEILKEGKKAVAAKMGLKTAKFNEMLGMVRQELEDGGVIEQKQENLGYATNIIEQMKLDKIKDGQEFLPQVNLKEDGVRTEDFEKE